MNPRLCRAFLLLVTAQAAHSVEEYAYRLFDVFAPARFVSGLVSTDPAFGFAVLNIAIVGAGLWSYWARVRTGHAKARAFAWFWACLELANGVGHVGFAVLRGSYFPGVATAPLLVGSAGCLAWLLRQAEAR